MSFLSTTGFLETPEQEVVRLAAAPEGSQNHTLSTLPVTIDQWPLDLIIELPRALTSDQRVVVVPIEYRGEARPAGEEPPLPRKRHAGSWTSAVIASDHPSYPVGGHRLSIPTAELVRGRRVDLFAEMTPNAVA